MELKIVILIVLINVVNLYGRNSYSQVVKVTLDMKGTTLEQVMDEIERQSEFYFVFNQKQIDIKRIVDVSENNKLIDEVLKDLFEGTNVNYAILDRKILLNTDYLDKKEINISEANKIIQQLRVTGNVTSQDGFPLAGVTVLEVGTNRGTITDTNGFYSIDVQNNQSVLSFSFIGMKSQEIEIAGKTLINIIMEEEITLLDEVITVGYRVQKRTTLTGSVSVAQGEDLSISPVSSIESALAGRLAGVTMRTSTGQPGFDSPTLYIRGVSTTGNQAPLVIVDGILRDNMRQIDPNSIESVTILKDAASVAPYGMAGANGVILITTKQGIEGTPKLKWNSYYGIQSPTYTPNVLNAVDYMKLRNEGILNDNPESTSYAFDPDIIDDYANLNTIDPDLYPNQNPYDLVNWNAPTHNHNLQLEGGSSNVNYFASLGYLKQEGIFEKVNYDRISYTLNTKSKATKTTTVTFNIIGSIENTNDLDVRTSSGSVFRDLYKLIPTVPLYYTNGLWCEYGGSSPVGAINSGGYSYNKQYTVLGSLGLEQDIPFIQGMKISGKISLDTRNNYQKGWHRPFQWWSLDTSTKPYTYIEQVNTHWTPYSYLEQTDVKRLFNTYQGIMSYNNTFYKHDITGLLVVEARTSDTSTLSARRDDFNVNIDEISMGPSDRSLFDNSGESFESKQLGFVYQAGYVFDNKYMIEATGRYDGHYYFAPGKRWGFFPAFSFGWRISEETFMDDINFITSLKLRGSWGRSGNLAGSPYQYLAGYTLDGNRYALGSGTMLQSARQTQESNPNITWEVSKKTDIGLEANLWNSLLTMEVDYFYEKRSGMLLPPEVTVPLEYGIALADENAGVMENQGVDLILGSKHLLKNGLSLNIQGNLSYSYNKMLEIFETEATYNNPNRRRTGRPYGTVFGYDAIGLFSSDYDKNGDGLIDLNEYDVVQFGALHPGDIIYRDVNGDKVIDSNDEVAIADPSYPLMIYGLNFGANWKGFDLNIFFQGASRFSLNTRGFQTLPFWNNNSNCDYEYYNNRWTPSNQQNALYPRVTPAPYPNNHGQTTDFWTKNVNYLRLKNITLGYVLPSNLSQMLGIESIRIYTSAENLLTMSNLKFQDPELPSATVYPNMRKINLGISVSF